MRMRTLSGAVGVLAMACVAAPAMAQDGEREFDGPYIGGSVGIGVQPNDNGESIGFDRDLNGGFGDTVTTTTGANAFSTGFCNGRGRGATSEGGCANDKDDIEYHVRAGWDTQMGNIVVGVVGEFGKSEVSDSVSAFSTTPAGYTMTREFDWNAGVRARAGYAAGGKTLFYAAGGPAYAKIKNSFSTTNAANSFTPNDDSTESWGFTAGGGVEQKIGSNFSVGLEYLYNQYQDDDYTVRAGPGTALPTNPFLLGNAAGTDFQRSDEKFKYHSMRATAAFRF